MLANGVNYGGILNVLDETNWLQLTLKNTITLISDIDDPNQVFDVAMGEKSVWNTT